VALWIVWALTWLGIAGVVAFTRLARRWPRAP
jgi:hypothetical protein